MNPSQTIAANLKKCRQERQLSLGQLADLCDVSKMVLSQIEKGEANPTINTVWKIANGLKVPYSKLLDAQDDGATVIRRGEAFKLTGDRPTYRVYAYFSTTPARNFEMFYAELDPGAVNDSIGHSDKSQEYIYIISGRLELKTSAKTYVLSEGDSVVFDPSLHHEYANRHDEILKFMVINYYP